MHLQPEGLRTRRTSRLLASIEIWGNLSRNLFKTDPILVNLSLSNAIENHAEMISIALANNAISSQSVVIPEFTLCGSFDSSRG